MNEIREKIDNKWKDGNKQDNTDWPRQDVHTTEFIKKGYHLKNMKSKRYWFLFVILLFEELMFFIVCTIKMFAILRKTIF